jgi:hypothetical protein
MNDSSPTWTPSIFYNQKAIGETRSHQGRCYRAQECKILSREIAFMIGRNSFVRLIVPRTSHASTVIYILILTYSFCWLSWGVKYTPNCYYLVFYYNSLSATISENVSMGKGSPTRSRKSHRVSLKNVKPFGRSSSLKMRRCKKHPKQLLTIN